ncbi:MAG: PspC protein [Flaviaesturariibacter sp.]|nr:PspC protein [Flaviaesturariibacter sp.]
MKKIININLSGRVIPIEDAAYESLQRYIESLRRYFANEEGRDEIINDIESRIAELMNEKVKKGAPAVSEADIEEIITAMGRIEDFEEVDAAEPTTASTAAGTGSTGSTQSNNPFSNFKAPKGRLYRDSADKIVGGVSSGIANYLGIDPAIVRIIFVLLMFGAGTGFLLYIILWIFVPKRPLLPTATKRFFRNPDDRILGGVAGGIGAYFNFQPWTVRLIFAAPLLLNILFGILNGLFFNIHGDIFPNILIGSFTGTFILAYIILWIILPEAKSTYEKMEMRGENVDVNRIKQNVQSEMENFKTGAKAFGQEVKETAQTWSKEAQGYVNTRGRSFAQEVSQSARPVANGVGHIIGVLLKAFLFCVAGFFALMFFVIVIAFVFGGFGEIANNFVLEGFSQKFLAWTSVLLVFGVPMIALITWLIRRIMRVPTHSRYLPWVFGGLWVLGIITAAIFGGTMARSFRYYNKTPQEIAITQPGERMIIGVQEPAIEYSGTYSFINGDRHDNDGWDITNDSLKLSDVKVRFEKSEDANYHVTVWKYSAGRNRNEAAARAQQIAYTVTSLDSLLNLGSGFAVGKEQKFRGQKVIVTVRVPVGKRVRFDESVNDRLHSWNVRIREKGTYSRYRKEWDIDWDDDMYYDWKPGVDYIMNPDGELIDSSQPIQQNKEGVYEYKPTNKDSLQRIIDEKERSLEEDRRRLREREERIEDAPAAVDTSKGTALKRDGSVGETVAGIPSPVSPGTI